ncbi:hypothetical protein ABT294_09030 [Nonomuraea sp. NPDC000554]|uniref:hypothetical protein n=1 Tax=Nonomuraea sp. NPDC000554 TaxID=3154259 RepID=UPI00332FB6D2
MPGEPGKRVSLVGAVALCALLTGCGSGTEGTAAPKTAPAAVSPEATPSPSETSSPRATPSPSVTASPQATHLPRAKDGGRLRACRDATCEVLVSDGQSITLDGTWGLAPVEVTVEDGSVTFNSVTGSGMRLTLSEQTPDQGGPSSIDDITFEVVAVQGRKAVIKIGH